VVNLTTQKSRASNIPAVVLVAGVKRAVYGTPVRALGAISSLE
jgi:hypothetical protein